MPLAPACGLPVPPVPGGVVVSSPPPHALAASSAPSIAVYRAMRLADPTLTLIMLPRRESSHERMAQPADRLKGRAFHLERISSPRGEGDEL
jgi:hypothetical protein